MNRKLRQKLNLPSSCSVPYGLHLLMKPLGSASTNRRDPDMRQSLLSTTLLAVTAVCWHCLPNQTAIADEHPIEALEKQLAHIERAIDEAADDENESELRELRHLKDKLRDRMERYEREWHEEHLHEREEHDEEYHREHHDDGHGHEDEHASQHVHHLQVRQLEIEVHMQELKLQALRQEAAARMVELASNKNAIFAFAIQDVVAHSEHPEHTAEVLAALLKNTKDASNRRLVLLHLVQLHQRLDQPERVGRALQGLLETKGSDRENVTVRKIRRTVRPDGAVEEEEDVQIERRESDRRRSVGRGSGDQPQSEAQRMQQLERMFVAYDRNRNGRVDFEEWIAMKEGDVNNETLQRERRAFAEVAGKDRLVAFKEFVNFMDRRSARTRDRR